MFSKVTLIGMAFTIVGIDCQYLKPTTIEKNGLIFTVLKGEFIIDGSSIPTLHRGAIANIEEMERLWLTRSNITSIEPGAFESLPNLKALYITYNNLPNIEVGIFNGLNISTLSLSDNRIQHIASHAFDDMTNLAIVDISFNQLKKWDTQWFAETPFVEHFFLNHNLFTEIPAKAFGQRKRTSDFYYISFTGNSIQRVDDDAFKNFRSITNLHITINNTDVLSGNFLKTTHFKKVDVRIDNVKCVDENCFSRIFVADRTKLMGNAFDRSCKSKIAAWATEHRKTVAVSVVW